MTTLRQHLAEILTLNRDVKADWREVETYAHAQAALDLLDEADREERGKGVGSEDFRMVFDPAVVKKRGWFA